MKKAVNGRAPYATASERETLNPREALDILETRARESEDYIIRNADVGSAVFEYLAEYGAPATRQAVAANPATPARINRLLAEDAAEEVRAELAAKIARLMPGLEARESQEVVTLTLATLEVLARDSAAKVRAILADEIKHLDCVPREVALRLAHDVEDLVAAPILEYSPLLSDADLMEIIAGGQAREALAVIARRRPLSEDVSDRLVQSLDVPAVAALLVNPDARMRKETLDRIVEEAEAIESWHEPLVLRADLSARAIRRIGGFVGASLLEQLVARGDLSDATRAHLNRRLRARLEMGEAEGGAENAAQLVAAAKAQGTLDDGFVENAAASGNRETVTLALASLAQVPEGTVRKMLGHRGAKPVVALVWRAHLSMRTAFKIQTSVMKLSGRELLPARGGINFPLSKEEMRWHLAYFDIPV
ncbi:MAG: DUF2336 domain-containing protein [Alphaproteobacteria bacterium]|jgi:uncharacterized protein (DUF2336 family)|nr:DUF2336 domain-containing protein [Alphaproteobacteria bacterium]